MRVKFLDWRVSLPFIKMGAHSLEVFSLSAVLTVATSVITLAHLPSLAEWLVLDAFVFVLLALTAVLLSFPANRAAGGLRRR